MKIAGRTYLDLSLLADINMSQLPEVALAARLYHLAHTHRALAVTGQCALWAHGYASIPRIPALTVTSSTSSRSIRLPAVSVGTHHFEPITITPSRVRRLPPTTDARGLLIESPEAAQITVARSSPNPRATFTQICMIGNTFTHFDNFRLKRLTSTREVLEGVTERGTHASWQ